jgi:uncharacterized membrane protein YjgN (DUF898 family)
MDSLATGSLQSHHTSAVVQANSALSAPAPLAHVATHRLEFSGSGGEYFRIWIVNLLLIFVTFGIYLPWAKVRKLKYFYGNTRLDDHAFDFHAKPSKMLRGTMIAGVFFGVYSIASDFSPWAGMVALLTFTIVWPVLYRASLKFRFSNTSWRGLRLRLATSKLSEVYAAVLPPNLLILVPLVITSFGKAEEETQLLESPFWDWLSMGFAAAFVLTLPYFLWRINKFWLGHVAWGPLRLEFRSVSKETYKVFLKTLFMGLLIVAFFAAAALIMLPGMFRTDSVKPSIAGAVVFLPLLFGFIIAMNILPRAFFSASMHNLIWSKTGNNHVRFKSDLNVGSYMRLQLKNYILIAITLGFYWPFAAVATKRMQIEAISMKSRVALDALTDAARKAETDALGDMAADMFDFDLGM